MSGLKAAIVDYQLGNLFSVAQACGQVGLEARITPDPDQVAAADIVFLPGVGAFGDAMANLRQRGLVEALKAFAASGRPLVGICLGLQLLLETSWEFGRHQGLGLIAGEVIPLEGPLGEAGRPLKVPQVGWNAIAPHLGGRAWADSPLADTAPGEYMYFVHSFVAAPERDADWLTQTAYGDITFCSALMRDNVVGFQFHPERSGPPGLAIYRHLARLAGAARGEA